MKKNIAKKKDIANEIDLCS